MTLGETAHGVDVRLQDELPGPAWLRRRRRDALEAFARRALPTSADEEWRYGRIGELDLGRFPPLASGCPPVAGDRRGLAEVASGALAAGVAAFLEALGERGGLAVSADGAGASAELDEDVAALGIRLGGLPGQAQPAGLGERLAGQADAFVLLADAFLADGVVLEVPPGVRVPRPIVIVHACGPGAAGRSVFPRTLVRLGRGAEATVVELAVSGDEPLLAVPLTEIELEDEAHLVHLSAQELGSGAWHLGYVASELGRAASLRSFAAALGGNYARHWSSTVLAGEGAESQLLSVYFGDGDQMEEFRTFQEHVAPRTRSELVFKGAVAERAHSVYTGLIRMEKGARRADASQTNRNLVLSEGAHAYSVPNLDIQENDVRCSHASAVGPIDPEQRFYLECRGVPTPAAERLILLGFFEDLLLRSPHAGFARHLRTAVSSRLARAAGAPGIAP